MYDGKIRCMFNNDALDVPCPGRLCRTNVLVVLGFLSMLATDFADFAPDDVKIFCSEAFRHLDLGRYWFLGHASMSYADYLIDAALFSGSGLQFLVMASRFGVRFASGFLVGYD